MADRVLDPVEALAAVKAYFAASNAEQRRRDFAKWEPRLLAEMEQADWRTPYRSRDASGEQDTAEAVGWAWIEAMAAEEKERDREGLSIESPTLPGEGRVIALYRGCQPIAVATIFRDPMNFAVLIRWRQEDPAHG